jgi:hypothetical protein
MTHQAHCIEHQYSLHLGHNAIRTRTVVLTVLALGAGTRVHMKGCP